jgi:hypothetical protein
MIVTLVGLLLAWPGAGTTVSDLPVDRPCKYEDSVGCVWDAHHMGNGEGKSFVVTPRGRVIYVSHRLAHGLTHD